MQEIFRASHSLFLMTLTGVPSIHKSLHHCLRFGACFFAVSFTHNCFLFTFSILAIITSARYELNGVQDTERETSGCFLKMVNLSFALDIKGIAGTLQVIAKKDSVILFHLPDCWIFTVNIPHCYGSQSV